MIHFFDGDEAEVGDVEDEDGEVEMPEVAGAEVEGEEPVDVVEEGADEEEGE